MPAAISIPYIHIKPTMTDLSSERDNELCIILFHSNAEDMISSLELGRFVSEALECQVFIPEYRGYSLLRNVSIDPDGI